MAFYLSDYLSRKGHDVEVFSPKYYVHDTDVSSFFKIHKLIPQFKIGNSAVVIQLAYFLIKGKFNVVHLHYPFMGASIAVLIAKFLKGKKIKLVLHYHMDLVGRGWKRVAYKVYNAIFLRPLAIFADEVISSSLGYLKNCSLRLIYGKSREKFHILPNGVDLEHFKPKAKSFSLSRKYAVDNKKVILFVGSLDSSHYFKGVNYLLKACQKLKRQDFKLIMVGEGDLRQVYADMADSYGLADSVVFTGYVPDESLVMYYNLCDIFVLPSVDKSEAFGMVIIEAMACAKPVIASDLPGVREAINKRINGVLVKPKDVDNLCGQINRLLDDKNARDKYGANGRLTAEESYGWESIVMDLEKIYES